jgi:hypothetical protein
MTWTEEQLTNLRRRLEYKDNQPEEWEDKILDADHHHRAVLNVLATAQSEDEAFDRIMEARTS